MFSIYGYKFCTAINLESAAWFPGYIDGLKPLYANGHEFMDHSPNHTTCMILLSDIADTSIYYGNPFVDHINENRICFKWESINTTTIQGEGPVNIYDNVVISVNPGEFYDFFYPEYIPMIFLPLTNQVYTYSTIQNINPLDPDTLTLLSLWEEPVNLGTHLNIPYHKLTSFDVKMPQEVLVMLGQRVLSLCESHSMQRPYTWIQPFGNFPLLHKYELAQSMGAQLGYTGGATYQNESYKTYNEYNPDDDKQFAMMFWDFSTTQLTAKENKAWIANGIAKHLLLISQNHFLPNTPTWQAYMQRTDSLLEWIHVHDIPVLTQQEWTSMLFDSLTNPFINVFPLLQTDLNDDQIPDGYELQDGIMINFDGVPQSGNKSIELTAWGNFFKITESGGLAKGPNTFTIYTKGGPGNIVWLWISYPETGETSTISIPAEEYEWTKFTTTIIIPEEASVVNFEMECHEYTGGKVRISGMDLRVAARPVVLHKVTSLMTNQQFPVIDLDTIIYDPNYSLQDLTITITNSGVLNHELDTLAGTLWVYKPSSFWEGSDSLLLKAVNPEGGADSSWLTFTATVTEICKGQSITLNLLNPPEGSTFLWTADPPDPSLVQPTVQNPTVSPQQTTDYSVAVNAPGGTYYENITVTVYLGEDVTLSGPMPACCANAPPVQLYGDPPGGVFSGPGVSGSIFTPALAAIGPNMLYYSVTDPSGCQGEDSLLVIIHPIPQVYLPPDTQVCHWQTVTLNAGYGYDSYLWSTGEMTPAVNINASGMSPDSTRLITLIVTKNGCPAFDTTLIRFKACTGIHTGDHDVACLQIYPNPVYSSLTIENNCSRQTIQGRIIDIVGNEIRSLQIQPGKNSIDLQSVPSGIYLLSVQENELSIVRRIVKIP